MVRQCRCWYWQCGGGEAYPGRCREGGLTPLVGMQGRRVGIQHRPCSVSLPSSVPAPSPCPVACQHPIRCQMCVPASHPMSDVRASHQRLNVRASIPTSDRRANIPTSDRRASIQLLNVRASIPSDVRHEHPIRCATSIPSDEPRHSSDEPRHPSDDTDVDER